MKSADSRQQVVNDSGTADDDEDAAVAAGAACRPRLRPGTGLPQIHVLVSRCPRDPSGVSVS